MVRDLIKQSWKVFIMYKILMVGNFSQAHCSEVHWSATLEDLGCQVTRIQENTIKPHTLPALTVGHDIFLWVRTWAGFVTKSDLYQIKDMGVPTVSLHLDLYVKLQRSSGLDTDMFWRTAYVFSADGDPQSAEVFKAKGINHHYLPPGAYKPESVIGTPREEFKQDIIFVGGGRGYHPKDWPYRMQLLNHLQTTFGSRYTKYGYPERTVRNLELNDLYASVKVTVGDSLNPSFNHQKYTSDRLFDATSRGAFLVYPRIAGIEEMLEEDKEVVYYDYGNFKELDDKVNYYLQNDEAREKIRMAGFERVKRDHTYHNRLSDMLDILRQEGAIK